MDSGVSGAAHGALQVSRVDCSRHWRCHGDRSVHLADTNLGMVFEPELLGWCRWQERDRLRFDGRACARCWHLSVRDSSPGRRITAQRDAFGSGHWAGLRADRELGACVQSADRVTLADFLLQRGLVSDLGHAAYGAIIAYCAIRRNQGQAGAGLGVGILYAVILHGLFDIFATSTSVWPEGWSGFRVGAELAVHVGTLAIAGLLCWRAGRIEPQHAREEKVDPALG